MGYWGALETSAQGFTSGLGIETVLGFNLGTAAAALLAAVVFTLLTTRLFPALEGASLGGSFRVERLVASALTAAGTYGFVKPALGLY